MEEELLLIFGLNDGFVSYRDVAFHFTRRWKLGLVALLCIITVFNQLFGLSF